CVVAPDLAGFDWPAARLPARCPLPRLGEAVLQGVAPARGSPTRRGPGPRPAQRVLGAPLLPTPTAGRRPGARSAGRDSRVGGGGGQGGVSGTVGRKAGQLAYRGKRCAGRSP